MARRVLLGLGSNLGDRRRLLKDAVDSLPGVSKMSGLYETDPVGGPPGQQKYLNLVVAIDSDATPRQLLGMCHRLESGAGRSLATALGRAGWGLGGVLGREDDVSEAAQGVDLLVIAVPDDAVALVAGSVAPVESTVIAHLAGSLGLDALAPHVRRAALHPLASLPSPEVGAERLRGAWFAIAGDPLVQSVVDALDGRSFEVSDRRRAAYHAAAAIASNHLV